MGVVFELSLYFFLNIIDLLCCILLPLIHVLVKEYDLQESEEKQPEENEQLNDQIENSMERLYEENTMCNICLVGFKNG